MPDVKQEPVTIQGMTDKVPGWFRVIYRDDFAYVVAASKVVRFKRFKGDSPRGPLYDAEPVFVWDFGDNLFADVKQWQAP